MRLKPNAQIRWLCLGAGLFGSILLLVRQARTGFGVHGLVLCAGTLCLGLVMADFVYRMLHGRDPLRSGKWEVVTALVVGVVLAGVGCSFLRGSAAPWTSILGVGLLVGGLLHLGSFGVALRLRRSTGRSWRRDGPA